MRIRFLLILSLVVASISGTGWTQQVGAQSSPSNEGAVFLPYMSSPGSNNQSPAGPTGDDPIADESVVEVPVDESVLSDEESVVAGQYVVLWKSAEPPSTDSVVAASAGRGLGSAQSGSLQIDVIDMESMTRAGLLSTAEDMLESYRNDPMVEVVEPNYVYKTVKTPNDPGIGRQYTLDIIDAYEAWDTTEGSSEVVIAVIDTGVDLDHPDLDGKLTAGYDFVGDDDQADDANGHGTHVAGIVAAETDNGIGGAGICPNCRIMPLRALNRFGSGSLSDIAGAITYATDNGADVINLSLGGRSQSTILQRAVDYAWENGVFVTCAAGNSGVSTREYPAGYSNCVAVAATTDRDTRASFSNYGSWVELAAPGQAIYSTYTNGRYANSSGTSMAAPNVAGLAGLLASQGLSNDQIRSKLCSTATQISGTGSNWTCGRIDAASAVAGNGSGNPQPAPTSVPPTPTPTPTQPPLPTPVPPTPVPPQPTAQPTPQPTPQPGPQTFIQNGGFENGASGWVLSNSGILSTQAAYSGAYSAQLGGENNSSDSAAQTVVVPRNGVLSYRWGAVGDYDTNDTLRVEIELLDGSGAKFIITNNGWNGYWYSRSIRMGSIAGKTVLIRFSANTNGQYPRTFYLDDVALQ